MTITIIGERHSENRLVHSFIKNKNQDVCLLLELQPTRTETMQNYANDYLKFKNENKGEYRRYLEAKESINKKNKGSIFDLRRLETALPKKLCYDFYRGLSIAPWVAPSFENWQRSAGARKELEKMFQMKWLSNHWKSIYRMREIIEKLIDEDNQLLVICCDHRPPEPGEYNPAYPEDIIFNLLGASHNSGLLKNVELDFELSVLYEIIKNKDKDIIIFAGEMHRIYLRTILRFFGIDYESSRRTEKKVIFKETAVTNWKKLRERKREVVTALKRLTSTVGSKEKVMKRLYRELQKIIEE